MKKLILLPLLFLSFAQAETIQCKVTEVLDGNNIICEKLNKEQVKVKLYQIDGPELRQAYGKKARRFLSIITRRDILIDIQRRDKYKNILGVIYYDLDHNCNFIWEWNKNFTEKNCKIDEKIFDFQGSDEKFKLCCANKTSINYEMIKEGYAWFDKSFGENPEYQQAQEEAKQAKRGLWGATSPIPPWVWREMVIQKSKKRADAILEEYRRNNP